jgi:hypothetical protein
VIPRIELKPTHAAFEKIELESDGNEIRVTLHYASVATAGEADAVAARVTAIRSSYFFFAPFLARGRSP